MQSEDNGYQKANAATRRTLSMVHFTLGLVGLGLLALPAHLMVKGAFFSSAWMALGGAVVGLFGIGLVCAVWEDMGNDI